MGLITALSNAVTGLNVNQQTLSIISQNIANANTPDYSAQTAHQQASFIDGNPQGVSIGSITRKVNDYLTSQIRVQTSTNSAASTIQNYYQQVENLLGKPGANNSMDQNINALFTSLQNAANTRSASAQTTVLNSANTLASQISNLANAIQTMRTQADTDIGASVSSINIILKQLNGLNVSLEQAAATNQNQSGLLDQRDTALKNLAQYMGISTSFSPDGTVAVNAAPSGLTLVGTGSTQLSYLPASSVQTFINNSTLSPVQVTNYDANGRVIGRPSTLITGGISGGSNGNGISSYVTGGKIGALVQVRDSILPNMLTQLDQLCTTMRDQINKVTNSGVSFPPPNSYTGERLVSGTQESQYTGTIRIAALNTDGSAITSPYADEPYGIQPLTLDLSKLDTGDGPGNVSTDGLIKVINQYFGQPQPKLELGNLNNIQLAINSDSVPAVGNSLNFDFSLNNISNSNAKFFVTGATVLDNNGNILNSTPTLNVPQLAIDSTNSFTATSGSSLVTLQTSSTNTLVNGDTIYLPPITPASTVGGIGTAQLGGYFKVQNVFGNTFQIDTGTVATSTQTLGASGVSALTNYATSAAGTTSRTSGNGSVTINLGSTTPPFYTVQANVATLDASGNVITSTVSYRVTAATSNTRNTLASALSQTGSGTIVNPTGGSAQIVASLVDASGNPIPQSNGVYDSAQGYLKIAATSNKTALAVDSMNSQQLGTPTVTGTIGGTNQNFSQYFGLNNFFKMNNPSATGDTLANSALNFAVTKRMSNNPTLLTTGALTLGTQPVDTSKRANYTYRVNSGDNSVAQQLAGLSAASLTFDAAGGLPPVGTTLSQYSGLIIAQTSTNLTNANNASNDSQTLLDGFSKQNQNISGVNLDQELANTVIYQNAYSASARVISIVGTLFQELMRSVGN